MHWKYGTPDLPGTGGELRRAYEDFEVEEIPLYLPCGEGDHVYFRVRKRGISTFEAVRRIAGELGVSENDVAYAGLKDARAVTTQWMSVKGPDEDAVRALSAPRIEILDVARHGNKLKVGHLRGNRFRIRVHGAVADAVPRAEAVLGVLVARGSPNYFGEQRFGFRLDSHLYGEAALRGDYDAFVKLLLGGEPLPQERDERLRESRRLFDAGKLQEAFDVLPIRHRVQKKALHALIRFKDPERAFFAIPKRMRQMFLSSFQSWLFNRAVEERVESLHMLERGDLAYLHRNGAIFPVDDPAVEQPRCDALELSPSGPIFGTDVPLAEGEPGERERRLLAGTGLSREQFAPGGGVRMRGLRRPLRLLPREVALEPEGPGIFRVDFALPSGSFATTILREITKGDRGDEGLN